MPRKTSDLPVLLLVLLTAALALGAPSPVAADDWPQFRGPNRDGKSAERGLLAQWPEGGPRRLWSVQGVGKGYSHVSVAGGLVYVTGLVGSEGVLRAYTVDGAPKWEARYGSEWAESHPGARSILTVSGGFVYVASGVGNVACFDAAGGNPVWSAKVFDQYEAPQVKWGFAESLLVDGENVLVTPCGKKATMVALDRKTGRPVWTSPALGHKSSFCSPVLVEHRQTRLIVTMTDSAVVAFSPRDGQVLWQHPYRNFRQNHCVTPIYCEGLLYVTSGYGKGAVGLAIADDARGVRPLWEQPKQDPVHGQAVVVDGYAYASSHQTLGTKWTCVDLKSGRVAWEDPCVGKGGSVIFADGMLYCYSEDGVVGLVRPTPEKCEVVSTFKVTEGDGPHWAHPVVANGRLYIRHGDALTCYDIAEAAGGAPKGSGAPAGD